MMQEMRGLLITLAGIVAWSMLLWSAISWAPRASAQSYRGQDLFENPPLGVVLTLPKNDVSGRPLQAGPRFAVFMGDCESCSVRKADPNKILSGSKVVFIFQGEKRGLRDLKAFEARGQCVFVDASIEKISQRIGYFPRAVKLDSKGMIVKVQTFQETVEEFCASQ